MALITLKTFESHLDANLLKTRLESEGIPAFLFDENLVAMDPLLNVAVGGIKLKISESDSSDALEILNLLENSPIFDQTGDPVKCPNCQSENLYTGFKSARGVKGILSSIISLLLMSYPLYYKNVYRCKECRTEFKLQPEK